MRVLGIETSCDETAAAVVENGRNMLSNEVVSSVDLNAFYGGVVPEIAARSHIESIIPVIDSAIQTAKVGWKDIDAIAVTKGPGLIGSLLIGVLTARTLAIVKNVPLYGVNHVEAHVYGAFIKQTPLKDYEFSPTEPKFPLLALIVSGLHTQLVLFADHFTYRVLGDTRDDAIGEAFDKVAKMLGLPYPGGPSITKAAENGNPKAIRLPKPRLANPYEFSFSGVKTAVLRAAQNLAGKDFTFPSTKLSDELSDKQKNDLAASFQNTSVDYVISALKASAGEYAPKSIVIAGGVAASTALREAAYEELGKDVIFPDIKLCTDNAAMIASLGYFTASRKRPRADPYSLEAFPTLPM